MQIDVLPMKRSLTKRFSEQDSFVPAFTRLTLTVNNTSASSYSELQAWQLKESQTYICIFRGNIFLTKILLSLLFQLSIAPPQKGRVYVPGLKEAIRHFAMLTASKSEKNFVAGV